VDILLLLIQLSLVLVAGIGLAFVWSVKSGQFDDLEGPAHRIVADDDSVAADIQREGRLDGPASLISINRTRDTAD
jgi:cbb3-type cytochrome oxidase maturation protein